MDKLKNVIHEVGYANCTTVAFYLIYGYFFPPHKNKKMKTMAIRNKLFDRSTIELILIGGFLGVLSAGVFLTVTLPSFIAWLAH